MARISNTEALLHEALALMEIESLAKAAPIGFELFIDSDGMLWLYRDSLPFPVVVTDDPGLIKSAFEGAVSFHC